MLTLSWVQVPICSTKKVSIKSFLPAQMYASWCHSNNLYSSVWCAIFPVLLSVLWFPGNMHQILYFLSICPCTYSTAFIYYFLEYHWSQLPCLLSYFVFSSSFYSANASTAQVWHCKASTSPCLLLTTVEPTSLKPALSSPRYGLTLQPASSQIPTIFVCILLWGLGLRWWLSQVCFWCLYLFGLNLISWWSKQSLVAKSLAKAE